MAAPDRFRHLARSAVDVVVVGAGSGGLTAAALLSRRGASVLVVDGHYVAGGNGTVFRRRGFEFDVGIHYLGECGPSGMIPRVLRAAGAGDVRFRPLDPDGFDTFRFPDFELAVPAGLARFRARLVERFPAETVGIDRYLGVIRAFRRVTQVAGPGDVLGAAASLPAVARWATATVEELLDACTRDARLRAVLVGQHMTYAHPPSRAAVATHAAIVAHYADGAWYPEGGGQVMADRLAAAIEAAGGAILLRTRASRILVERGRVTGVELDSHHLGRRVVRAPVVISNADLKHTMRDLVGAPHLPPATLSRIAAYEMSPGLGVVYLGVRRDLAASGLRNANYVVFPDYDQEAVYAAARAGRFVERPPCYLSLTSLKDPDNPRLAPPGVANIQLMTVVPSAPEAWGATRDDVANGRYRRSEAYQAAKHAFAERMIDQAETVLPGLRREIVHREVATPLTHTRFTGSSGGTSYGIALTPAQSLWRRPTAGTGIDGLHLCGASTITGHGIAGTMLSGVLAAARVAGWRLVPEVMGAWS